MQTSVSDMGVGLARFVGSVLWHATPWILFSGIAGLLLAIFLIVYLARGNLLKRHSPGWNLLAKAGYVVIFVTLPLAAATLGGLYGIQSKVNADIESGLRPLVSAQMPKLRSYVVNELRRAGDAQAGNIDEILKPVKRSFSYVATSNGSWERTKSYWVNDVVVNPAFSLIARTLQDKLIDKLGGSAVAGSAEGKRQILNLGATLVVQKEADNGPEARKLDGELTGLVMSNLFMQLNGAFSPVYFSIFLTLLGITCLLLGEMLVYRRFYRPRPLDMDGPGATGQGASGA